MSKALERAQMLIRLATNTGAAENEARNAAMQAVKLIVKESLLGGGTCPTSSVALNRRYGEGYNTGYWEGIRVADTTAARERERHQATVLRLQEEIRALRSVARENSAESARAKEPIPSSVPGDRFIRIVFMQRCRKCGDVINPGERAWQHNPDGWSEGAWHDGKCYDSRVKEHYRHG